MDQNQRAARTAPACAIEQDEISPAAAAPRGPPEHPNELGNADWSDRIARIAGGSDQEAEQSLYQWLRHGVRLYLAHRGARDVEDMVHEVFIAVLTAIRDHRLRASAGLPGFVRTIARRAAAKQARDAERRRAAHWDLEPLQGPNPEQQAIKTHDLKFVGRILSALPFADRAILRGFYLGRFAESLDSAPPSFVFGNSGRSSESPN